MGLFSGSDKTYVSTTTNRLVEDSKFISSVKSGTVKSIFAKSSDTVDYIMEDLINGLGFTAKQYYKFGRDKYPYGLPHASGVSQNGGGRLVEAVLKDSLGQEVTVIRNEVAAYNFMFEAVRILDLEHALNPTTGELKNLSNLKGIPVYLAEVYLMMSQSTYDSYPVEALQNHTVTIRPGASLIMQPQIDNSLSYRQIRIYYSYIWQTGSTTTGGGEGGPLVVTPTYSSESIYRTDNIGMADYNPGQMYFQTVYRNQGDTNWAWWRYRVGDGFWPTLDRVFDPTFNQTGSYFPWAYFRYNKVKGNADKTDAGYLASKKLLKKIHLDYDTICNKIHENPDIENVEQAMLIMAIEADSKNKLDMRYLYEYFDSTFIDSGGQVYDLEHSDLADPDRVGALINNAALVIQDARFKMGLSNMGMYRRTYAGSIGPVGTYDSGELALSFRYYVTQENEGGSYTFEQFYPVPSHFYRKQVQPGYYDEILIFGLSVRYNIWGDYGVTANGDTDDSRTDLLLIPVDLAVSQHFSLLDREEFYSRSLYFVFNARVTVHLAWYQSDFFQFLMIVVSFAIMLYTGMDTFTSFLAGTATMTATEILIAVLITGLEYLATGFAFKLFVKMVGVKIAFLVALIGMAYGYSVEFGDKVGMNLSKELPYAGDLLKASQGLAKAVKSEYEGDMLGMKKELDALKTDAEALGVKIKSAADEMADNSTYTAFIPLTTEEPEDFFNRTIHAGNIGIIGIDAVSNYVERSLMLPEPKFSGA